MRARRRVAGAVLDMRLRTILNCAVGCIGAAASRQTFLRGRNARQTERLTPPNVNDRPLVRSPTTRRRDWRWPGRQSAPAAAPSSPPAVGRKTSFSFVWMMFSDKNRRLVPGDMGGPKIMNTTTRIFDTVVAPCGGPVFVDGPAPTAGSLKNFDGVSVDKNSRTRGKRCSVTSGTAMPFRDGDGRGDGLRLDVRPLFQPMASGQKAVLSCDPRHMPVTLLQPCSILRTPHPVLQRIPSCPAFF